MTARVAIGAAPTEHQVVPLSAVIDQGSGPLVWVVVDGKAVPRPVKLARFGEAGAEISAGLNPGELVVITGTSKLVANQPVTPQLATPPAQQR
jgi:RecJ-like exonuclease